MRILDKLWNGELNPAERKVGDHAAYSQCLHQMNQAEKALMAHLSPEAKICFDNYEARRGDLAQFLERDAFSFGFRVAGLLMLDVLGGTEAM